MYILRLPEYKDSFMNIKFDYCKCIRIYEKAHLRSDFWQSIDYKYITTYYKSTTLVEGKNSCTSNEWSLMYT